MLLDRSDVRDAILEEVNATLDDTLDTKRKACTLRLVEDLNLKRASNDMLLHMILEVVGHQIPPTAHLHSCFDHNMSYREFLVLNGNGSNKPPLHPLQRPHVDLAAA